MCQNFGWLASRSTMMSIQFVRTMTVITISFAKTRFMKARFKPAIGVLHILDGHRFTLQTIPGLVLIFFLAALGLVAAPPALAQHHAFANETDPPLFSPQLDSRQTSGITPSTAPGSTITGSVWHDTNHDGVYAGHADSSEPGHEGLLADVDIVLYQVLAPDSQSGRDQQTQRLRKVKTVTTSEAGTYTFAGLELGEYVVEFGVDGLPIGHRISHPVTAVGMSAPNGRRTAINVDPTTRRSELLSVTHHDSTFTVNMGIWLPVSVGNRVWLDEDGNGIQDPDEVGIPNVNVSLYSIERDEVLRYTSRKATTDARGFYSFAELEPGIYGVEFVLTESLAHLHPTRQNQGNDDAVDSDFSSRSLLSEPTSFLMSGRSDSTLDLGLTEGTHIGDRVWEDRNGDGYQDDDEPGIAGVSIRLREPNGHEVAEVQSSRDGSYLFQHILPGTYYLNVEATDGWQFSPLQVGRAPTADSDIDPDSGESPLFSIRAGNAISHMDVGLFLPSAGEDASGDESEDDAGDDRGEDVGDDGKDDVGHDVGDDGKDDVGGSIQVNATYIPLR